MLTEPHCLPFALNESVHQKGEVLYFQGVLAINPSKSFYKQKKLSLSFKRKTLLCSRHTKPKEFPFFTFSCVVGLFLASDTVSFYPPIHYLVSLISLRNAIAQIRRIGFLTSDIVSFYPLIHNLALFISLRNETAYRGFKSNCKAQKFYHAKMV